MPFMTDIMSDNLRKALEDKIMTQTRIGQEDIFICFVCNTKMSSYIPAEAHIKGSKHLKKLRNNFTIGTHNPLLQTNTITTEKNISTNIEGCASIKKALNDGTVVGAPMQMMKCTVCEIVLNSTSQMEQHLLGQSHNKKLKLQSSFSQCSKSSNSAANCGININNLLGQNFSKNFLMNVLEPDDSEAPKNFVVVLDNEPLPSLALE